MDLRRVRTIFNKDLRDAIRDARVLVALLVPFSIGVFYNLTFNDDPNQIKGVVLYSSAEPTDLPNQITRVAGSAAHLTFRRVAPEALSNLVQSDGADLGLALPAGFDGAIARGDHPRLEVIHPATATVAGDFATAAIDPALRAMAGQAPPADVQITAAKRQPGDESITDKIGLRTWAVLGAIVTMIGMIAMLAVPVILAEESEKKTLDALVLIASYVEVIVGKALVGVVYVAVMVPLLLAITRIPLHRPVGFVAAVSLLTVGLIGFGLLMAGIFKNANQLNTWSGILLLPVIAPAFAVGLPTPDWVQTLMGLLPAGAAAKLMINSAATDQVFRNPAHYLLLLVVWAAIAYGLLYWQLSRREA